MSGLRLRMKVWTDPVTQQRYLVATGFTTSRTMMVYVMRDDDTRLMELTIDQWNTLPFYYFKEDGEAPRPSQKRPPDEVKL